MCGEGTPHSAVLPSGPAPEPCRRLVNTAAWVPYPAQCWLLGVPFTLQGPRDWEGVCSSSSRPVTWARLPVFSGPPVLRPARLRVHDVQRAGLLAGCGEAAQYPASAAGAVDPRYARPCAPGPAPLIRLGAVDPPRPHCGYSTAPTPLLEAWNPSCLQTPGSVLNGLSDWPLGSRACLLSAQCCSGRSLGF